MRGRDISRYEYSFADLWLINTHNGIKEYGIPPVDINDYPAIKAHLDTYWDKLSKRYDKGDTPYNLRNCIYTDDFSKQKIIWGEISDKPKFALDETGEYYVSNTVFFMTGDNLEYLIAFLNSKLSEYYFSKIATTTGVGTVRWLKYKIEQLPVPNIKNTKYDKIRQLPILIKIGNENSDKIDDIIFELFSFTSEERKYILNQISNSSI